MIPGVVFKIFRSTKSSIQNRTRTRTLIIYIYMWIYIYIYVSNRIVHQSFSLYNFIQASKKYMVYPKLRPNRIPTHWSPTKRKPTLWRIRLMPCDRHFFWFLQRICRHRKNRRHRNAGNTEYIHVKDRFLHKNVCWCKCASFPSARFWRSRRSRMRSRMWVRSAGWVCARFMLDISHFPVFMDI